jgi:hypothetical protein
MQTRRAIASVNVIVSPIAKSATPCQKDQYQATSLIITIANGGGWRKEE